MMTAFYNIFRRFDIDIIVEKVVEVLAFELWPLLLFDLLLLANILDHDVIIVINVLQHHLLALRIIIMK